MFRLTHRRCRQENEGLAAAAHHQTERAEGLAVKVESLADDLRAAEHQLAEIKAACEDPEYTPEAVIPEYLREQLLNAHDRQFVLGEHSRALDQIDELTGQLQDEQRRARDAQDRYVDARDRMLAAAHTAGTLARTYALVDGAGMAREGGEAEQILVGVRALRWHYVPGWECQDSTCHQGVRELLWHESAPERAHLVCECGRIWQAGPGDVARGERETHIHQALGSSSSYTRWWSEISGPVLEAVDRALPTPAEFRQAVADAA